MQSLILIGKACKDYRLSLGILQSEVAKDTGYSIENVSKFENGNNNNMKIFLWYLEKGFRYEKVNIQD
jgi:transcriptional regulator with XRE-family HTH domain